MGFAPALCEQGATRRLCATTPSPRAKRSVPPDPFPPGVRPRPPDGHGRTPSPPASRRGPRMRHPAFFCHAWTVPVMPDQREPAAVGPYESRNSRARQTLRQPRPHSRADARADAHRLPPRRHCSHGSGSSAQTWIGQGAAGRWQKAGGSWQQATGRRQRGGNRKQEEPYERRSRGNSDCGLETVNCGMGEEARGMGGVRTVQPR